MGEPERVVPSASVDLLIKAAPDAGDIEAKTVERLNGKWTAVFMDQYGPDGTVLVGRIAFASCPVCHAMVAPNSDTGPNFPLDHAAHHVDVARWMDEITETVIAAVAVR